MRLWFQQETSEQEMRVKVLSKPTPNHWAEVGEIWEVSDAGVFWVVSLDKMGTVSAQRVIQKSCCEIIK